MINRLKFLLSKLNKIFRLQNYFSGHNSLSSVKLSINFVVLRTFTRFCKSEPWLSSIPLKLLNKYKFSYFYVTCWYSSVEIDQLQLKKYRMKILPSVTSVTKVTPIDTSVQRSLRIKLVRISKDHHRRPSNLQTATILCTFYYQVDEEFTFLSRKQIK